MADKFVKIIDNEREDLPNELTERVFMVGNSMGCMMTIATLLSWPNFSPWGGAVCMIGLNPFDYSSVDHSIHAYES